MDIGNQQRCEASIAVAAPRRCDLDVRRTGSKSLPSIHSTVLDSFLSAFRRLAAVIEWLVADAAMRGSGLDGGLGSKRTLHTIGSQTCIKVAHEISGLQVESLRPQPLLFRRNSHAAGLHCGDDYAAARAHQFGEFIPRHSASSRFLLNQAPSCCRKLPASSGRFSGSRHVISTVANRSQHAYREISSLGRNFSLAQI
jgi:hypothetical protein